MIRVRLAELADLPALPEIERSAGEAFRDTIHAWVAEDDVTEIQAYPPLVAQDGVRVAEHDGVLAGFVLTEVIGDELHVWELAVARDHQRRGIGATLMAAAGEAARAAGCRAVTLTTFRSVPFNAPFYARLGFRIDEAPVSRLAEILARETARGLTDRCAMRAVL